MTLNEFGAMVAAIDPAARRYANHARGAYTVWMEYAVIHEYADGEHLGGYRVQLERYSPDEDDAIAAALRAALDAHDEIAYDYIIDPQVDGEKVMIRHLFDCEVS